MEKKLMNDTKKCSKCGRILPISEFGNNKTKKDGLQCWCRECSNEYNQANKQTHNQYNRQYYKTNSQHLKEYQKQYYQANKQTHNQQQKEYYSQFKGYYVYIILGKNNEVVYVGQTTNYYNRLYNHLSKGVDSTKELFSTGEWSKIKYLDVSGLVANEMELRALENELIHLYNPRCNTVKNIIRNIDEDRLFSIVTTLHSMDNEWEEFKTNNN